MIFMIFNVYLFFGMNNLKDENLISFLPFCHTTFCTFDVVSTLCALLRLVRSHENGYMFVPRAYLYIQRREEVMLSFYS